jgi:GTP cyclohydrolase I
VGASDGDWPGPATGSATEPDDGELDYLAARLINGRLGGAPVERAVDLKRIEDAVREILIAIGEDPDRDGLRRTPVRVAQSYAELFAGLRVDPAEVLTTTFEADHDELVLVRDIEVFSLCEHHLLPFHGVTHVGYIPGENGRITGLSKLARLVDVFARRPQIQERFTTQIADLLMERLQPRGVIVVVECEHMCMAMRGIQKAGSRTVTSAVRGVFQRDAKSRAEAMSLIMHS